MSVTVDAPSLKMVNLNGPTIPRTKWEREYQAFQRLLPKLLLSHRNQFVAIHDELLFDHDSNEIALIDRVIARLGNVDFHVGQVTDQAAPIERSGLVRSVTPLVQK